jgi:integrase
MHFTPGRMARISVNKAKSSSSAPSQSEDYLQAKQPVLSERGFIIERSNLKHLLSAFGSRLVSDIDAADIDVYQKARLREGAAAKTINLEIGTLRAILLRNRLWEPIRQDVRMLKVEDTPGKALTNEEEEQLLAACLESRSRGLYPSVVLALNTGMRSADLRWLQWKQIDLRAGSIRVGRSKTAAGAGRTIPLNRRALEALKDWAARFEDREPEHYVFPSEQVRAERRALCDQPHEADGHVEGGLGDRTQAFWHSVPLSRPPAHGMHAAAGRRSSLRDSGADHGMECLGDHHHGEALRAHWGQLVAAGDERARLPRSSRRPAGNYDREVPRVGCDRRREKRVSC